jgi:hypothetical protein
MISKIRLTEALRKSYMLAYDTYSNYWQSGNKDPLRLVDKIVLKLDDISCSNLIYDAYHEGHYNRQYEKINLSTGVVENNSEAKFNAYLLRKNIRL